MALRFFTNLKALCLILCSILLSVAPSFAESDNWHYQSANTMGTQAHVQLYHPNAKTAEQTIKLVFDEFTRIDNAFSPYKKTSELYRINHRQSPDQSVSHELAELIHKARDYSELTQGAFDITFASIGEQYDYKGAQSPSEKTKAQLLPAINYKHLLLNPDNTRLTFKHPNTRIDLGGIAKGYAVDRAIDIIQRQGIENASVSAGGDARVIGQKNQRPWMIGIKHPRQQARKINERVYVANIPLTDSAISTSGDYERFFINSQGVRIHHILNPVTGSATGVSSSDQLISVSVIGPRGFDTDPLSTSVFVLGLKKGLALIDTLPDYEAVVINADKQLFFSQGLAR